MKKNGTVWFRLVLQLLLLLFCTSCGLGDLMGDVFDPVGGGTIHWKIIPGGLRTSVSGQFYEVNRRSPIADLKVYVAEYISDPLLGLTRSKYIDSTRTDQNGNYEIPFVTTGDGVQYQVSIKWPDVNWLSYYGYPLVIEEMGANNIINVQLAELSILEAKIKIIDNHYPPMRVGSDYRSFYELYGADKDTTLFLRVMPNRKNRIFFFISMDTLYSYYYRERIDTINMEGDFSDTIRTEFELHPNQFKRRE